MPGKKQKWSSKSKKGGEGSERDKTKQPQPAGPPSKYAGLFEEYREELDTRYDKHERLVKLSRDTTIHSKRTIFLLHRISGSDVSREEILSEAESKFHEDVLVHLRSIAIEIAGEDPAKHHRAFSPGLQEFIEALAYYEYLKHGRLITIEEVQNYLTFQPEQDKKEEEPCQEVQGEGNPCGAAGGGDEDIKSAANNESQSQANTVMEVGINKEVGVPASQGDSSKDEISALIKLPLGPVDYVLGLADLTGELMRLCINCVGSGNRDLPFKLLPFFRSIFCGFHSIMCQAKVMGQKMRVLRTSLGKVENVCYTLKVRGSEIPKHMLVDVFNAAGTRHSNMDTEEY